MKISGGDGSSYENAIVISDCSNQEGVQQEYKEVRKEVPYAISRVIL